MHLSQTTKTAIVVGASSGIGEELAKLLARKGYRVALVARRREELDRIAGSINKGAAPGAPRALAYAHDVANTGEVPVLFQRIVHELGGFHLIVYCAGVMPKVAEAEYNTAKDRTIFEVNVIGAMAWLNEAAARCEQQEGGIIAGISSVAGDRGRKGFPAYAASKAALNAYLEGLRNRLGHRGVRVVTIKPGPVRTAMTEGLKMPFMIDADDAARQIYKAIHTTKTTAYVPLIWWPIMTAIRLVPSFLFRGKNI